jgi:hypothetical protein
VIFKNFKEVILMNFKVNVNMFARVKLNELGVSILKEQHDELNKRIHERGGEGFGEFKLKLDDEGYYRTQLWIIMWKFGSLMKAGIEQPFDTNIIIENGEPL